MLKDKELFDAVGSQAVRANGVTHLKELSRGDHDILWDHAAGAIVERAKDPMPRAHVAADLETIVQWAQKAKNDGWEPVVWYARQAVICVLDDKSRRDTLTLPLSFSQPVLKLLEMNSGLLIGQAELIWLLRTTFRHSLRLHPTLIETFRGLRWEKATDSQQRGVSLGKNIEAKVNGVRDLPESFGLECPAFAQNLRIPDIQVEIAVDVDHGTEKFRLLPIPGMLERCLQMAEQAIGSNLRDELGDDAVVSFGKP